MAFLVFCETEKNKKMLDKYVKIIDEIKEEILFIIEYDLFVMGKDFMRFRFETNDNLPYNRKFNVKVYVISISSVLERRNWFYSHTELQECFHESDISYED